MRAFRKAHELKLLSEVQYKQWIDLLLRQDLFKEALQVAEAGTELFKDSVTMWQTKLLVLIDSKSPDVGVHFEEAFAHLKPQVCLSLWISWAEWSESVESQEDTEAIFKRALLAVTGANSITLKEKYLDWAYRSGGYKKARAVFKRYSQALVAAPSCPHLAPHTYHPCITHSVCSGGPRNFLNLFPFSDFAVHTLGVNSK